MIKTGTKFWDLEVLKILNSPGRTRVIVLCVCGAEKEIRLDSLKSGNTKSCGCKKSSIDTTTHGFSKTKTYRVWDSMLQRTTNPSDKGWENYGGRGIKVCKSWRNFENFLEDMGEAPPGLQLDRKDNDLGYYKENYRWVTPKKNASNKRNTIFVDFKGQKVSFSEAVELSGIKYPTLQYRYRKGLRGEELFKTSRSYS